MKKLGKLFLVLASLFAFVFASCSDPAEDSDDDASKYVEVVFTKSNSTLTGTSIDGNEYEIDLKSDNTFEFFIDDKDLYQGTYTGDVNTASTQVPLTVTKKYSVSEKDYVNLAEGVKIEFILRVQADKTIKCNVPSIDSLKAFYAENGFAILKKRAISAYSEGGYKSDSFVIEEGKTGTVFLGLTSNNTFTLEYETKTATESTKTTFKGTCEISGTEQSKSVTLKSITEWQNGIVDAKNLVLNFEEDDEIEVKIINNKTIIPYDFSDFEDLLNETVTLSDDDKATLNTANQALVNFTGTTTAAFAAWKLNNSSNAGTAVSIYEKTTPKNKEYIREKYPNVYRVANLQ